MRLAAMMLAVAGVLGAADQYTPANAEWNRAVEPFRVAGNVYYVGMEGVSAFLITTPKGHFLLDTGFMESAPMVAANIEKLGFHVADVRMLLISHGHYDHVGGVAAMKKLTGAKLLANPVERPLMERGGKGDFAFGDRFAFPPVSVDGGLKDGEAVRLGGVTMTAHFTPGHTKGCTTWSTVAKEGGRDLQVVFACSTSAPGYQLVDNPKYPEIQKDFATTFSKLRALPCDVFLGGHSWDFGLLEKQKSRAAGGNPFIDAEGYRRFLDRGEAAIRDAVAKQTGH